MSLSFKQLPQNSLHFNNSSSSPGWLPSSVTYVVGEERKGEKALVVSGAYNSDTSNVTIT